MIRWCRAPVPAMTTNLLLKIAIVPAFIFGITRTARRFGPVVGGWLTGLPVVAGPIMFFVALDQGPAFASKASLSTLVGLIALSAYSLVYAWVSRRAGWAWSLLWGWLAFVAAAMLLERVPFTLPAAFAAASAAFVLAVRLLPDTPTPATGAETPRWEIHVRMAAAVALVLLLTTLAAALARISHRGSSRDGGDGRGYKARELRAPQA
ncbi:MAG: hypothetical protein M1550_04915 [Deltaproteobacteria bacterium]|nr:hypothetical protein [Deltaproteobacteria bacterium]